MKKPFYLGLSVSELSKIVMYEFWYDYVKQNYGKKCRVMLHGHKQLYSIHKSRRHLRRYCKNIEVRFDTSNYKLPKENNKKKID